MGEVGQQERNLAALAHLAVLVSAAGVIVPAIIWLTQRQKSAFVGRHAVQATAWQLCYMVVTMTVVLGAMASIGYLLSSHRTQLPASGPFALAEALWAAALCLVPLFPVVGLVGGVHAWRARPFIYPFIGRVVEARFGSGQGKSAGAQERDEGASGADRP